MATLAIVQAAVIEVDLSPIRRNVTLRALARIVIGRPRVASLTVGKPIMAEGYLSPIAGYMA